MFSSCFRVLETIAYQTKNRIVNIIDRPVIVLIYHRVTTLSSDPQMLAVSPDNFRAQMKYLKSNFPVVRFEDDWSHVNKPAVAITFDDGYADNAREAGKILEEIEVPATFFISTGNIGSREAFWWDELEHIVLGSHDFPEQFVLTENSNERVWQTSTESDRRLLYSEILPRMVKMKTNLRESCLEQLRQWGGAKREGACEAHRAMTVEELRQLAQSRWVTIGAHSVTHTALSALIPEEQRQEIIGSKKTLEEWLGREVTVFSFPYGSRKDYTPETVKLCQEAGFLKAAANFPAQVHSWTDSHQIPRQLVRNWPVEIFAKKLNRFWFS